MSRQSIRSAGAVVLCAGLGLSASAAQVTANWLAPVSGTWIDPTKWSGGQFPNNGNPAGTTYHAVIDAVGGPYEVSLSTLIGIDSLLVNSHEAQLSILTGGSLRLDGDSTVERGKLLLDASPLVGGLSGVGGLNVKSEMEWRTGTISGPGSLRVDALGALQIAGNGEKRLLRNFENFGETLWSKGNVQQGSAAVINHGQFIVDVTGQSLWDSVGVPSTFDNFGTVIKRGFGSALIDLTSSTDILRNEGAVVVESGTLSWLSRQDQNGAFLVGSGGALRLGLGKLTSSSHLLGSGRVVIDGTAEIHGEVDLEGELEIIAGDPQFYSLATAGRLIMNGSSDEATFHGDVRIYDELVISQGTIRFLGNVALAPGASIEHTAGTLVYENTESPLVVGIYDAEHAVSGAGDIRVTELLTGTFAMSGAGSTIIEKSAQWQSMHGVNLDRIMEVHGGATLTGDVRGDGSIVNFGAMSIESLIAEPTITNHNLITKTGAGLSKLLLISTAGSLLDIQAGVVEFDVEGSSQIGGQAQMAAGTTLRSRGAAFQSGSSLTGDGLLETLGGATTFALGSFGFEGEVRAAGGTLSVLDDASLRSVVGAGGSATFSGALHTENGLTWSGAGNLIATGGLTMGAGASMVVNGGQVRLGSSHVAIEQCVLTGGSIYIDGSFEHAGLFSWTNGSIRGAGVLTVVEGGTLAIAAGTGQKFVDPLIVNHGDMSLGASLMAERGLENQGHLTMGANTFVARITSTAPVLNWGTITKIGTNEGSITPGITGMVAIENEGHIHVQGGILDLRNAVNRGLITADAGATLRLTGSFQGEKGGVLTGEGKLAIYTGVSLQASDLDWRGLIEIQGGAAHLAQGFASDWTGVEALSGTLYIDDDMSFSAPITMRKGQIVGPGALQLSGALTISSAAAGEIIGVRTPVTATEAFSLSLATLDLSGGRLTTQGASALSGGRVQSATQAAEWLNSGTIQKGGQSATTVSGSLLSFINEGDIQVSGGTLLVESAFTHRGHIGVDAGAHFRATGPLTVHADASFGGAGLLTLTDPGLVLGSQFSDFSGSLALQSGSMTIEGGAPSMTLSLQGGTFSSPSAAAFQGVTVQVGSAHFGGDLHVGGVLRVQSGQATLAGDLSFSPAGILRMDGVGTLNLGAGAAHAPTFEQLGGVITGSGDLHIETSMIWAGGTQSGGGRTIVESGAEGLLFGSTQRTLSRAILNEGEMEWRFGSIRFQGGLIENSGVFTASTNQGLALSAIGFSGENRFLNHGLFVKEGELRVGFDTSGTAVTFDNRGRVEVREGVLALQAFAPNQGDTHVAHLGTLEVTGDFINDSGASLSFEVGGVKERGLSGLMTITGEASLAGTLSVETPEAFEATWGDRWVVMTYGSVEGDFDVLDLPTEGFASRSDDFGASDLRWYAARGETEYAVGVSHAADIDHDGLIGFGDLNVIASNFNAFGSWAQGDVDGDGFVGFTDLNAVLSLFNVAAPRSVPAPGAAVVLVMAAGAMARRRGR